MRLIHYLSILTLIAFSNCGGHTSNAYSTGWDYNQKDANYIAEKPNGNYNTKNESLEIKKMIYSAYFNLTVKNIDTANHHLTEIAKKYNGYVETVSTTRTVIRVKSQNINKAVADIEQLGKTTYKNLSVDNVSARYVDLQMRLDNALKSRNRYLELLKQAENVEAALKVEKELERLNLTIEQLKSQMNQIDKDSDMSKITVNLTQKKKLGPLGYVFKGVYLGVKWLFVRG